MLHFFPWPSTTAATFSLAAILLAVLFTTQLFLLDTTVRLGYGFFYLLLALLMLARDVPLMPTLWGAARETVLQTQANPEPSERAPP